MRYIQLLITLLLSGTSLLADKNEEISKHPATQVTFSYLKNAMGQDWEKAANLIEPLSLENLKTNGRAMGIHEYHRSEAGFDTFSIFTGSKLGQKHVFGHQDRTK